MPVTNQQPPASAGISASITPTTDGVFLKLKSISEAMRDAALCEQWEHFLNLGQTYVSTYAELSQCLSEASINEETRRQRAKLLIEILDNDTLIKSLVLPEMSRVSSMMAKANKNRAAIKAYHEQNNATAASA